MHVYIIERSSDKLVKIGKSDKPNKRIKMLEMQGGFKISRKWVSPSTEISFKAESAAHAQFHNQRFIGEWFTVDFDDAVLSVSNIVTALCESNRYQSIKIDSEARFNSVAPMMLTALAEEAFSIAKPIASIDAFAFLLLAEQVSEEVFANCIEHMHWSTVLVLDALMKKNIEMALLGIPDQERKQDLLRFAQEQRPALPLN